MKALVIGATGSTGAFLVDRLLVDPDYSAVVLFLRSPSGKSHPKLSEHLVDFSKLESYKEYMKGDVAFSCLGTTLKAAGSKEKQWAIDFEIPLAFAKLSRENNCSCFVLVSAADASSKSPIFYSKMKGTLEDKIALLDFKQFIIFRPGLLLREGSDRLGEKIMVRVLKGLNRLGLFKKYKPLPTALLAQKLAKAPKKEGMGIAVIALDKIFDF